MVKCVVKDTSLLLVPRLFLFALKSKRKEGMLMATCEGMSLTESELLYACRYAVGMILKDGSVEYLRLCGGILHRTSWFDIVDEIDNRLSRIEAESGGEE